MATANGTPGYKLSILRPASEKLRAWKDDAVRRGIGHRFAQDLLSIERRLRHNPLTWGDPLFDYHHLGLTRRRGRSDLLFVYYSVHEQGRVVFVQDVAAAPHGPFDSATSLE
jgi:hypothetical protein